MVNQAQRHLTDFQIGRYGVIIAFAMLLAISLQTPLLEFSEERLSTHMVIEHAIFFLIGALSVMSAERILQILFRRERQRQFLLDAEGKTKMTARQKQQRQFSRLSKALWWWSGLLRRIFKFGKSAFLWLGVAIVLMAFWHFPPIFNAAALHENIHILQHFSFIIVGASGFISTRVHGESFKIFLLIAIMSMMGFGGLLFSVLQHPVYGVYPLWQHNEAGTYMIISSILLLVVGLPTYLIRKTILYAKVIGPNDK